jgi:release factor glutamine methyltransferase
MRSFEGFQLATHPEVYAPAEDTSLMLRALRAFDIGEGDGACDVGTGTGVVALAMARRGARVVAVDVNPHAARLARANAAANGLADRIAVVRGSLLAPLRGPFDLIVFNPPYLPVEGESRAELARAWEGGAGGIGWAPLFVAGLHRALAPGGRALVLLSSLGDPRSFAELAVARGFLPEVVAEAKLPWELLQVFQVRRGNL